MAFVSSTNFALRAGRTTRIISQSTWTTTATTTTRRSCAALPSGFGGARLRETGARRGAAPFGPVRWVSSASAASGGGGVGTTVQSAIDENVVMVFATTYCPFCHEVKALFKQLGVEFVAWDVDTRDDGADVRSWLLETTGQRTVPNVFIRGTHVGGCDGTFLHIIIHAFFLLLLPSVPFLFLSCGGRGVWRICILMVYGVD